MIAGNSPLNRSRRVLASGLGLALFLTLFVDVAVMAVPIYDMQLYDRVLLSRNMSTVAMLSLACGGGLLIYGILDYLRSAVLVVIADQVGHALSVPVLEAAVRRGMDGDSGAGAEALRDLNEIQNLLSSGVVATPLDALCAPLLLAVMYLLHPAFFWLGLSGISLLTMLGILSDVIVRPKLTEAAQERANASHQFGSGLSETELTEGLGMFPALARRWTRRHAAAMARTRIAGARSERVAALARLARMALQAAVMAMGVTLIISNHASAGSLMGANLLLAKVLGPFDALVSSWRRWIEAGAAWRRISVLIAAERTGDRATGANVTGEAGLVLDHVSFRAPLTDRVLLHEISLTLPPGTATALTGANGAGKSTLLRLLVGVLPPTMGAIRVDGTPLVAGAPGLIGYLPQGCQLLDGSIAENVARFATAPFEDVILATKAADMHETVGRMRRGYDTAIGQAQASLSGGQRQRIALARALYGAPRLLVLDEPDASLDHEGEQALARAIDHARSAGAVIIIATHRPALLALMDQRLILRDGHLLTCDDEIETDDQREQQRLVMS